MARNPRPIRVPVIPETNDPAVSAIKEAIEVGTGQRGPEIDRFVRFRDLEDSGFAMVAFSGGRVILGRGPGGVNIGPFQPGPDSPPDFGFDDLTKPPAPTNVRARGLSMDSIGVTWDPPPYGNHSYSEIFASKSNSWTQIRSTFNQDRPIGPGNQSPYFMGRSGGSMFLHRNLSSTIPTLELTRPINAIGINPAIANEFTVVLVGDANPFVSVGDTAYLTAPTTWDGAGVQGEVLDVTFSAGNSTVRIAGPNTFDPTVPEGAEIGFIWNTDDLNVALNPTVIYYWVRFVSTASVVGDVQGETGAPGQVMRNPEDILNILTGRIRSSQLANDLIAPINFIRGPITEVDEQGNRLFPTVRDFVLSLGSDLISDYDEDLERIFLGYLGDGEFAISPVEIVAAESTASPTITLTTAGPIPGVDFDEPETLLISVFGAPGTPLEAIATQPGSAGPELRVLSVQAMSDGFDYVVSIDTPGIWPGLDGPTDDPAAVVISKSVPPANPGVAAAAAFVRNVAGHAGSSGAWIQSLETLQAAFEVDTDDEYDEAGVRRIISTIASRKLVEASDDGALAHISDNLQVEYGDDGEGNPTLVFLNEVTNRIQVIDDSVTQSFTVKLQQNLGGVLYAAGFGLGLESDLEGNVLSTFAVAADQFAIMAAGRNGRLVRNLRTPSSSATERYLVVLDGEHDSLNGLGAGARVVFATSPDPGSGPLSEAIGRVRGKTFEVMSVNLTPPNPQMNIREVSGETHTAMAANIQMPGTAIYPENSIPFIVNTQSDPPVVGIRGSLIVDGMITANDAEITGLLTANAIWSQSILNWGLIDTESLVGEQIATPRWGGWAWKVRRPDASFPRVMEFSKWDAAGHNQPDDTPAMTDGQPIGAEPGAQASLYPQLRGDDPSDTSFFLDTMGNVYVRGNLSVGGNARFWTGYQFAADHYVQMDSEFPFFVMPSGESPWALDATGDLSYNDTIRQTIRAKSLVWVEKTGNMGFNTQNGAIFAGSTPMEPPSGRGFVRVLSRLDNGAVTGMGRVFGMMQFGIVANVVEPDNKMGIQYELFLAPAGVNYGQDGNGNQLSYVEVPSQRSGGAFGHTLGAAEAQFMDAHFIIIRAACTGSANPYRDARNEWFSIHGHNLISMSHLYNVGIGPQPLMGTASAPASPGYKLLVVVGEQWKEDGSPLCGPGGPRVLPYAGNAFVQQVSNTPYPPDAPLGSNTGSDGSGSPDPDPGDGQGPLPGDSGGPIIIP